MHHEQPTKWYDDSNIRRRYKHESGVTVYVDNDGREYPSIHSIISRINFGYPDEPINPVIGEGKNQALKFSSKSEINKRHLQWYYRLVGILAHEEILSRYCSVNHSGIDTATTELIKRQDSEVEEDSLREIVGSILISRGECTSLDDSYIDMHLTGSDSVLNLANKDKMKVRENWLKVENGILSDLSVEAVEVPMSRCYDENESGVLGWAGQVDIIGRINDKRWVIEIKTSPYVRGSHVMQAEAQLRMAPTIDNAMVVRLGRDFDDYEVIDCLNEAWPSKEMIWNRFKSEMIEVAACIS